MEQQQNDNSHAFARSRSNGRLASNYPPGYTPSRMELDSDAWLDREMWDGVRKESQAEHTRRWLEEEKATGRIALLCDEANYRVSKSERAALSAISKAMANV